MNFPFLVFYFTIVKALDEWKFTQVLTKTNPVSLTDPKANPIKIIPSFKSLIKDSDIWVDKSLIISEIWENPARVFIVTAPRRWGKTTIASMIGYYHELPLKEDGSEANRTTSGNYLYFTEGKITGINPSRCNAQPLISKEKSLNSEHLANHPVIYFEGVSFSIDDNFLSSYRSMIRETYQMHSSLHKILIDKSSTAKNDAEKAQILTDLCNFEQFYQKSEIEKLTAHDLTSSIRILTDLLAKTYKRKVIIIFDEYDSFISDTYFLRSFQELPSSKLENNLVKFFKAFVNDTFKCNENLAKGIITGILPIHEAIGLSDMKNVVFKHAFGKDSFLPYYGIFEKELRDLSNKRGVDQSLVSHAVARYDGYHLLSQPKISIYPTYSIIEFINAHLVGNYWTSTSMSEGLILLLEHEDFRNDVANILKTWRGHEPPFEIQYEHMLQLTLQDFSLIHSIDHKKINYTSSKHRDTVFSFLVSAGYISVHPDQQISAENAKVAVTIPNTEIFMDMKKKFIRSLQHTTGLEITGKASLKEYMKHNDSAKLKTLAKSLSKFVFKTTQNIPTSKMNKAIDVLSQALNHPSCISGNMKTFETLILAYFLENSLHRAPLEEQDAFKDEIIKKRVIDVFFMDDCKTSAVIVQPKYIHVEDPKLNPLLGVFQQCLSYISFFRSFDVPVVNFLAVLVHQNSTVELMSIGMESHEVKEWISDAVQFSESKPDLKGEFLRGNWSRRMFRKLNDTMPSRIWYAKEDPNLSQSVHI
ncbi:uncharacterized protein LOC135840125 [Planococcus citri]|uniref:uncharacterized protein LOC135840125 n=1 Tax=Planococcus citri TaxID=170843 RepID=UPI0031F96FF9